MSSEIETRSANFHQNEHFLHHASPTFPYWNCETCLNCARNQLYIHNCVIMINSYKTSISVNCVVIDVHNNFQLHAEIKLKPHIEDGAGHMFRSLQLHSSAIQLSPKHRKAVMKKLRNNTYFAHPEAVILASLGIGLEHLLTNSILDSSCLIAHFYG